MGEQKSAKSLRGDKMEDGHLQCGSDARKPTATAEVRLKFSGFLKAITAPAFPGAEVVIREPPRPRPGNGHADASAYANGNGLANGTNGHAHGNGHQANGHHVDGHSEPTVSEGHVHAPQAGEHGDTVLAAFHGADGQMVLLKPP